MAVGLGFPSEAEVVWRYDVMGLGFPSEAEVVWRYDVMGLGFPMSGDVISAWPHTIPLPIACPLLSYSSNYVYRTQFHSTLLYPFHSRSSMPVHLACRGGVP